MQPKYKIGDLVAVRKSQDLTSQQEKNIGKTFRIKDIEQSKIKKENFFYYLDDNSGFMYYENELNPSTLIMTTAELEEKEANIQNYIDVVNENFGLNIKIDQQKVSDDLISLKELEKSVALIKKIKTILGGLK